MVKKNVGGNKKMCSSAHNYGHGTLQLRYDKCSRRIYTVRQKAKHGNRLRGSACTSVKPKEMKPKEMKRRESSAMVYCSGVQAANAKARTGEPKGAAPELSSGELATILSGHLLYFPVNISCHRVVMKLIDKMRTEDSKIVIWGTLGKI